jgi:hypothetical protein
LDIFQPDTFIDAWAALQHQAGCFRLRVPCETADNLWMKVLKSNLPKYICIAPYQCINVSEYINILNIDIYQRCISVFLSMTPYSMYIEYHRNKAGEGCSQQGLMFVDPTFGG